MQRWGAHAIDRDHLEGETLSMRLQCERDRIKGVTGSITQHLLPIDFERICLGH
jgi:hypothetical protein